MSAPAKDDRLVQHGLFLMLMSQVANVTNLLFHVVMGRGLGPDEYGILATLLNLMLVLSTPLDALRTAMAHATAHAVQAGDRAGARALALRWLARVAAFGVPAGLLLLLAQGRVAGFFHLETSAPVQIVALALPVMLAVPVVCGMLQGAQSFVWMSLSMHGWGVVRLLAGWLLLGVAGAVATDGVLAHALAQGFALAVALLGLRLLVRGAGAGRAPSGVSGYFGQSLLMLAGFGVLMNSDVMLVRHFHPEAAGHFAWAATIGRSVIFLPMPITLAMFPKVISMGAMTAATRRTLLRAMAMTAGLTALAVGAVCLLPWLPLRILYGVKEPTAEMEQMVRWVCVAMSPLGLAYVLVNFEMAQRRFARVPWLLACAAGYLGAAALWHASVWGIVLALGLGGTLAAAGFLAPLFRRASESPIPSTSRG